jgi:hypothetical protein
MIEKVKLLIKKACLYIAFERIKSKAWRLHKKYDQQIFVVKIGGKIKILSKYQFKQLRQTGKINKSFTAESLKKIALFYTPKHYDKKRIQRASGALQAAIESNKQGYGRKHS